VSKPEQVRGRRFHVRAASFFAVASIVSMTSSAAAQDYRLNWEPSWRRVGAPEYAATAALFAGHVIVRHWVEPAATALWTRPLPLDEGIRNVTVARASSGRRVTGRISDTVALLSIAQPLIIDSLFVAGLGDHNSDVAWQLEIISLQSYSITVFLNTVAKRAFARERPYGVMCARDKTYTDCEDLDRFRSFYSGHAAMTATSAGLVCAHHTHVPLYGGGWADPAACLGALFGTIATGTLRIASDRHWASDVFVGHVLGLASGFVLPSLLYYRGFSRRPSEHREPTDSAPSAAPQPQFFYADVF
jgi:membrane-associated phospholipid phosphatase